MIASETDHILECFFPKEEEEEVTSDDIEVIEEV